jgi:hypothetical protein
MIKRSTHTDELCIHLPRSEWLVFLELRNPNRARGGDRAIDEAKRDCALTDLIHNPLSDAKFEMFFDDCLFIWWYITYD